MSLSLTCPLPGQRKEQRETSLPWQRSLWRRSGRTPALPYPPHRPRDCTTPDEMRHGSEQTLKKPGGLFIRVKVDFLNR